MSGEGDSESCRVASREKLGEDENGTTIQTLISKPLFQSSDFSHLDRSCFLKSLFVNASFHGHDGWSG